MTYMTAISDKKLNKYTIKSCTASAIHFPVTTPVAHTALPASRTPAIKQFMPEQPKLILDANVLYVHKNPVIIARVRRSFFIFCFILPDNSLKFK